MESTELTKAVELLAEAYRTGEPLGELPGPCAPRTEAEAYAIQDTLVEHCGWQPVGWKVGATNETAQRLLGQKPSTFCMKIQRHGILDAEFM